MENITKIRAFSEDGYEIPFLALALKESFDQYYSVSELISIIRISSSFITIDYNGTSLRYYIDGILIKDDKFVYKLIPLKVNELINYQFPKTHGLQTFESLMNTIGIKVESQFKTESVYWDIPRCKLLTLMNLVQDNILITTGGGTLLTFVSSGALRLCDLKSVSNTDPSATIPFTPQYSNIDLSWRMEAAGQVRYTKFSVKGTHTEIVTFKEGFGISEITELVTIDQYEGVSLREARNIFWRNYYTSTIVRGELTLPIPLALGDHVEDMEGNRYIVYEVNLMVQGETVKTELVLVNNP